VLLINRSELDTKDEEKMKKNDSLHLLFMKAINKGVIIQQFEVLCDFSDKKRCKILVF